MILDAENILPNIRVPEISISARRNDKHNSGRWKSHEHEKFLEAVIIYGNDWKLVQKCIRSRSSTQARSHAQKFLLKLKKKLKIEPDSNNKLSKESIDKIVREIVENSSFRNTFNVDKEKLVKLIMGFSNLLVGKVNSGSGYENNDTPSYNQNFQNYSSYYCDNFFADNKKVFHIEKVVKSERRNSLTYSTADSISMSEPTKPQLNQIQIQSQQELLKYLLQNTPQTQDPSNPNKNVINIISINICNKNEGESNVVNNNTTNTSNNTVFPANLFQNAAIIPIQGTNQMNQLNQLVNLKKTPNTSNNISNVKSIPINLMKQDCTNSTNISPVKSSHQQFNTPKKEQVYTKEPMGASPNVNKTICSSASTANYERDFYENQNANASYFNPKNAEEDDIIDKFFDF